MGDKNETKIQYQERNQTKMIYKYENFKKKTLGHG